MYTQTQQRPVMTQPPQGYQKRTKKVLAITDPNTGKNIMDDIMPTAAPAHSTTPPHSGSNSSRATPVGVSADVSSFFRSLEVMVIYFCATGIRNFCQPLVEIKNL